MANKASDVNTRVLLEAKDLEISTLKSALATSAVTPQNNQMEVSFTSPPDGSSSFSSPSSSAVVPTLTALVSPHQVPPSQHIVDSPPSENGFQQPQPNVTTDQLLKELVEIKAELFESRCAYREEITNGEEKSSVNKSLMLDVDRLKAKVSLGIQKCLSTAPSCRITHLSLSYLVTQLLANDKIIDETTNENALYRLLGNRFGRFCGVHLSPPASTTFVSPIMSSPKRKRGQRAPPKQMPLPKLHLTVG